jgi:glycosyltransferase involved in cell wall biosynthesis
MKILHVTQNYFPSVGGPQYTMKHVSEKLVQYYSDDVQVATTNSLFNPESSLFKEVKPAYEVVNGVAIHRLPFNRWHYPLIKYGGKVYGKLFKKQLPASIAEKRWSLDSPAIDNMMRQTDADVIMATTINYNFCNYPLWRNKTSSPKPFILYGAMHMHKHIPYNDPAFIKARACDCYIANTEFERQQLISNDVEADKIVTIGTGINMEDYQCTPTELQAFRAAHSIAETDIVVGFVGRLVKGKGVAILIDALRSLQHKFKNVKLLLAGGTTDYVPVIRKAIQEENLPIILIENFAEAQKAVLFNAIDVFVLASQSESFGVVFLEAWSCSKPVVGTRMGATESLLTEGKDSLLFMPEDVDELCQQLTTLIENKPLRLQLGHKGFEKVKANYTWPTIINAYRDAYLLGIANFADVTKAAIVS